MSTSHPSHILYQNSSQTLTLIDIPHAIEQAQLASTSSPLARRLISSTPLSTPYPSVEPKSQKAIRNIAPKDVKELMLERYVELALAEVREDYQAEKWCLERVVLDGDVTSQTGGKRKRKLSSNIAENSSKGVTAGEVEQGSSIQLGVPAPTFFTNPDATSSITIPTQDGKIATAPPNSSYQMGEIIHTLPTFTHHAPKFDVILLDPPWPNRSASRKNSYSTAYGPSETRSLLSSFPLHSHLQDNGYIAVWLTNKHAFREMVLGEGGLFDYWGVELVEEWIWVKVTVDGEPVCEVGSVWRKPWEVLVIGRNVGAAATATSSGERKDDEEKEEYTEGLKRRVIIGVPDLHSRKPNLKYLFGQLLGKQNGDYAGLEIFARNLTAGWWSWGNEVLKFQIEDCWVDS